MDEVVMKVLRKYELIADGCRFIDEHAPIIEKILAHQGDERISVQSMGEEIMGKEEYHKVRRQYERYCDALSLTGTLTQAFRKMCKAGILTRHEERAKEPITIEVEDWAYFDEDGNALPDVIEVQYGSKTIKVKAENVRGTRYKYGKVLKQVHPKVVYYTFN